MTSIATAWGIGDQLFLALYCGLCIAAGAAIWTVRRRALGSPRRSPDPTPDIGLPKMAMLTGGPRLAITTAAAKLHRDGVLAEGPQPRTHVLEGSPADCGDRLERELVGVVRGSPGISTAALREELVDSEPIRSIAAELRQAGLLMKERTERRLRWLWCWSALLALLGLARIASDSESPLIGYLTIVVVAVACSSVWLGRRHSAVTARGHDMIRARRSERDDLRRAPRPADSALAAALYGGGALWLADPALASILDVPRERAGWILGHDGSRSAIGCSSGDGVELGGISSSGGCGGGGGGCGGGG